MKRYMMLFLVAAICFGLIGCQATVQEAPVQETVSRIAESAAKPVETIAPPKPVVFRNASWGMTRDEVIKSEGKGPDRPDELLLVYDDVTVSDMNCVLAYKFDKDKLIGGIYYFAEAHTNENDYITDYATLVAGLTEKYGEPTTSKVNWKNDLFKDEPQDYGLAVSIGDLEYQSIWNLDNANIICSLYGDNYKISLAVVYSDPENVDSAPDTSGL
jgi:hypothetical protein